MRFPNDRWPRPNVKLLPPSGLRTNGVNAQLKRLVAVVSVLTNQQLKKILQRWLLFFNIHKMKRMPASDVEAAVCSPDQRHERTVDATTAFSATFRGSDGAEKDFILRMWLVKNTNHGERYNDVPRV
ncbi:MAG: hypothetical protein JWQ27_3007 [Ferruginibacter sp.]|nr:hypothetical protein [Ferruginibacter sp.]